MKQLVSGSTSKFFEKWGSGSAALILIFFNIRDIQPGEGRGGRRWREAEASWSCAEVHSRRQLRQVVPRVLPHSHSTLASGQV
jgi:hypothetical protein